MKRMVTLFAMLAVVVSMTHAQVYASVYQKGGGTYAVGHRVV